MCALHITHDKLYQFLGAAFTPSLYRVKADKNASRFAFQCLKKNCYIEGKAVHNFYPSIWKAEAGGLEIKVIHEYIIEFQVSLNYMRPYFKRRGEEGVEEKKEREESTLSCHIYNNLSTNWWSNAV